MLANKECVAENHIDEILQDRTLGSVENSTKVVVRLGKRSS